MSREAVVSEAMKWLKTPYHANARVLGAGVDCAQFPCAVYSAVGLVPDLQPVYDRQWFQHRDEELYLEWVRPYATEISPIQVQPGDFLIWQWGRTFSHGAIVVSHTDVIHAQEPHGVIISNFKQDCDLSRKAVKAFTLWGK